MVKRFSKAAASLAAMGGLVALFLGVSASAAHADLLVTSFYTQLGSTYQYDFRVENQTGVDISVINVMIPTSGTTYTSNALAPSGYTINIDEGSGSLVLAEDTSFFGAGTIVDGFHFDSTTFIPSSGFEALDSDGNLFTGSTVSVAVPEAGTLPLLLGTVSTIGIIGYARRRRIATIAS